MGAIFDRSIGAAARGPAPADGARALLRRSQARRSASRRDRALAARPRRHPRHRHARGAADARRARGADRRGLRRRRPRLAAVDGALQEARRRPDVPAARGRRSRSAACMHVGYPVAVVVADTLDLARDAAERVAVDYAPRPAVVSARDAFEPGAPQLYDDCPNNEAYFYQAGDKAAIDAAFAARRARGRAAPRHQPRHRQSRSSRAASPANTTPAPAATRCIAASSGHGCSATPSPRPR